MRARHGMAAESCANAGATRPPRAPIGPWNPPLIGDLSSPPTPTKRGLATVVVLTCNRPKYAAQAVRQISAQDYRPLEILVVDDGSTAVEPLLRQEHPGLVSLQPGRARSEAAVHDFSVRLLTLPHRMTIGEKRTKAARAARGEIILHWDDDDFHEPRRVSAQVSPILAGEADLTALQLKHVVLMPGFRVLFAPATLGILWSSLAYRATIAREHGFANVSLGEDYEFADRAVRACRRFVVVEGVDALYTRHERSLIGNTYHAPWLQRSLDSKALVNASTPSWLTSSTLAAAEAAEADASGQACPVVSQRLPSRHVKFPWQDRHVKFRRACVGVHLDELKRVRLE